MSSAFDRPALIAAGCDDELVDTLEASYWSVRKFIDDDTPLAVGASWGKDSLVTLGLTAIAYRDAVRSGAHLPSQHFNCRNRHRQSQRACVRPPHGRAPDGLRATGRLGHQGRGQTQRLPTALHRVCSA